MIITKKKPERSAIVNKKTVIKVEHLYKTFKNVQAVKDLSFEVYENEFVGILGPNGAGKTTTMKILHGKARRDKIKNTNKQTTVNVFGFDPLKNELQIKALCGIVPQEDNLDGELNVIQNLQVYARLYGIKNDEAKKRIDSLLDFMELSEKKKNQIKELSGGMKRRLTITRALLNNPRLLIMDEPTIGLDPQVRLLLWEKVRQLKKEGVTLLLTTHYMEEAFQLCDKVIIMNNGKKVLEGNPRKIIQQYIEVYVLEIHDICQKININLNMDIRMEKTKDRILLFSNDYSLLESISSSIDQDNYHLRKSNLEDVFLIITGRDLYE